MMMGCGAVTDSGRICTAYVLLLSSAISMSSPCLLTFQDVINS